MTRHGCVAPFLFNPFPQEREHELYETKGNAEVVGWAAGGASAAGDDSGASLGAAPGAHGLGRGVHGIGAAGGVHDGERGGR